MKPITPRVHGVIDYAACAAMLAAPALLHLKGGARTTSAVFAASYLGVSALTDYPLGLRHLIPFPVHGKIELASVPALLLVAALQKGARKRVYFLALAGTVLTVYSLTDWQADPEA
ncbi:hypothetical protein E5F05_08695 [Deinococcus metallilatus]|uniref:Uncharacterized protein n=1 Tax=Deinococcus metallilatus TaxID=1211322 RepID=A0AAJ5JY60_9DEIO|nr:hypothetical protein [Deinococcus metallilatus]MBB5295460.1 hypothetical protein [Deinococcus metallilatus]QBY08020.1 hypothetical protein E5F05_08695 [Deinococcus metallilatus]RXJ12913.1 hypothetical protein ERJ73_07520 [Deinococcus metallilatus]TLK27164.1 hypothetical protein FCS05_09795 [Deinococcus metallilatus]GMA16138.1 hypothetical protein GCM10025871_24690 [Deinococcus metallilatus]